jgi:transcriptional regulator with XRE-family HTH domain
MPQAIPGTALEARVRAHFCLTQAELARFIGVTAGQVAHLEAGRRQLSSGPEFRLALLGWLLPRALGGMGPDLPEPAPEPLPVANPKPWARESVEREALEQRLRRCRFYAIKFRYQLGRLLVSRQERGRREWAVQILRRGLRPLPGEAPLMPLLPNPPVLDPELDERWLKDLEGDTAAAPVPTSLKRKLLELRIRLCDEEAAGLEAILADSPVENLTPRPPLPRRGEA